VENHIRSRGDIFRGIGRFGNVRSRDRDLTAERQWRGGNDHVEKRQFIDWLAVEAAIAHEALGQLAANHAGRACNEDVHAFLPGVVS
jgi:hypothetical protein